MLDLLWEPMAAQLGEGCAMDPSVFCWIAAAPDALPHAPRPAAKRTLATEMPLADKAAPKRAGANFGVRLDAAPGEMG